MTPSENTLTEQVSALAEDGRLRRKRMRQERGWPGRVRACLSGWTIAITIWAVCGFLLGLFGYNLRFHIGLLALLLEIPFLIWTAVIFGASIWSTTFGKSRAWAPLLIIPAIYAVLFFGGYPLFRIGDRIVFESQRWRYEHAISRLEAGESPETACAAFRFKCGVTRTANGSLRVVFYHPEFYDKALGYVYDPSGDYGRMGVNLDDPDVLTQQEREAYRFELIPYMIMFCEGLSPPYYRCSFA
jgi:hypothetical protein